MNYQDFSTTRRLLKQREVTLPEIVAHYFLQIEKKNSTVNAFTFLQKEEALKQASLVQKKIEQGEEGPLAGMVMGIKEVFSQKGVPCTCASKMLESYEAVYDATVLERLLKQDAVVIGRLNMDEFAMGSSTENSIYGPARNPYNPEKVTGGSSGGSAAAVAAEMCTATLGSDTGGSVRQPASFCGVIGIKPSYGRVSRHGLIAYASSFDSVGAFASSVTDAAIILKAIAGQDAKDATSSSHPVPDYPELLKNLSSDFKIGIPSEYFDNGLDPEIEKRIMQAARKMEKKGAKLVDISLPHLKFGVATFYILATAEASSNLARYDGIRYGHRAKSLSAESQKADMPENPVMRLYKESRTEGFSMEVKRRILLGTYVLSAGYYDAYYAKAQRVRRRIKQDFDEAFSKVDVIISPTTPTTSFDIGSKINDPLQMYLNDIYTISANLAGICGISIPFGTHPKDGMPIGVQLMADAFCEPQLLNAARLAEKSITEEQ